ncbi:Metallo-dependent phosphatase-like [Syntrophomonas zehnderi OL-4]|uniref:Metallo-dependent phosphatase-like n=2 Tax=Syntrophomonas TaxID=862 RepID=A0A0E4GDY7_9FIRM|nr:Metallo-dependent phosphatase-like [Syntrophomonas zehnderi OL-4]
MNKKMKTILAIVAILVIFIVVSFNISNNYITTTNYFVASQDLPTAFDGYKILQLSDLHSREFGKNNYKLINKIDKVNPDIVVMTGDMVNSKDENYDVFISLSQALAAKYDVYFVIGNHEQCLGKNNLQSLTQKLTAMGVNVLDNNKATIVKADDNIALYGMWFNLRYYSNLNMKYVQNNVNNYFFSIDKMNQVLGKKDAEVFSILLTHNPAYFETYLKWGADLTLAGHIHGGMVRLPWCGGIFSPEKIFFPPYDAGEFSASDKMMIVSRGLGIGNEGFRYFNCPELVVVTLKK